MHIHVEHHTNNSNEGRKFSRVLCSSNWCLLLVSLDWTLMVNTVLNSVGK